ALVPQRRRSLVGGQAGEEIEDRGPCPGRQLRRLGQRGDPRDTRPAERGERRHAAVVVEKGIGGPPGAGGSAPRVDAGPRAIGEPDTRPSEATVRRPVELAQQRPVTVGLADEAADGIASHRGRAIGGHEPDDTMPSVHGIAASENIVWRSALECAALIREKQLSPVELTEAILARVEALNPRLNAFCLVAHDVARRQAREAEIAVMKREPLGAMHGVPISIKDVIYTRGIRTTGGSRLFADLVPEEDAVAVG